MFTPVAVAINVSQMYISRIENTYPLPLMKTLCFRCRKILGSGSNTSNSRLVKYYELKDSICQSGISNYWMISELAFSAPAIGGDIFKLYLLGTSAAPLITTICDEQCMSKNHKCLRHIFAF